MTKVSRFLRARLRKVRFRKLRSIKWFAGIIFFLFGWYVTGLAPTIEIAWVTGILIFTIYCFIFEIVNVDIKNNLKVELYSDRGIDYAEARFNCVIRYKILRGIARGDDVRPFPQFFVVRFRQEDGHWRVRDYEMQDPRSGIGT